MKSLFFLAAISAPLIAQAEPGEAVRGLLGPSLRARSAGIDPSTLSEECQSQCTYIINTLDVCTTSFPTRSISLTQRFIFFWGAAFTLVGLQWRRFMRMHTSEVRRFRDLHELPPSARSTIRRDRSCRRLHWLLSSLTFPALSAPIDVATAFGVAFQDACAEFGLELNEVTITATPTGISSTGDPFSIFEVATPTSGATAAVTVQEPPLIPSLAAGPGKKGGAVGLSALRSLDAAAVGAVAAVAIVMGGLPL